MSKKKNKISNPLSGIPTKSLIITLVMILLCIACGFGFGYCARGLDDDQRENQVLTAYAEASSVSSSDYMSFNINLFEGSRLFAGGVSFTFLLHSLPIYPDSSIPVFSVVSLTPSIDLQLGTLSWFVGSDIPHSVSYSNILSSATIPFGGTGVNLSSYSTVALSGSLAYGSRAGTLEGEWELLRVEGFYNLFESQTVPATACMRAVYNNGFSFVFSVSFSSSATIVSNELFGQLFNAQPNFVFYNTSETGLTAEAYERGKLAGMADLEDLVREANQNGYNRGKAEGEQLGYQRGLDTALEDISPFNVIVSGVNSFLRTEILPGVQLTIILSVGFGLLLLGFAIKIFLGG